MTVPAGNCHLNMEYQVWGNDGLGLGVGQQTSLSLTASARMTANLSWSLEAAPPRIVPSLQSDQKNGGVDLGYTVTGAALPQSTDVALYWASAGDLDHVIGGPIPGRSMTVPAGTVDGSYYPFNNIPLAALGAAPSGATYLLAVADRNNVLGSFSSSTSVVALALSVPKQNAILTLVNKDRGTLPAEFLLAEIFDEGGRGAFYADGYNYNPFYKSADAPWAQPSNGDGIMQVTCASGFHEVSGPYTSDQDGYDHAIMDGADYLNELNDQYGNLWQAALHYNTGPNSLYIYKTGKGDPQYLNHVAAKLQDLVPPMFHLANPSLVGNLRTAQQIVKSYLNNPNIASGQSAAYYKSFQAQLDNDLSHLRGSPTNDLIFGPEVDGLTSSGLQTSLAAAPMVGVLVAIDSELQTVVSAINGLTSPATPSTVAVILGDGAFSDVFLQPPAGVTVLLIGDSNTTIVGQSPALAVSAGNVLVSGVSLSTTTAAPTVLVTGGALTLRDDTIQESTGFANAAVSVTDGTVDLGTVASPGYDTLGVDGAGALILDSSPNPVSIVGDVFEADGQVLTDPNQIAALLNPVTATTLSSSLNPSIYGEGVSFTATVAGFPTNSAPTGTVQFQIDGNNFGDPVALVNGSADSAVATLFRGSHVVSALYSGDGAFLASTGSLPGGQTIMAATPTLSVTGGSFAYDEQPHAATGTVGGVGGIDLGIPTFTYSYTDDNGSGVTTTTPPTSAGYYTVTASFPGNDNYLPATATATITIYYDVRTLTDLSHVFNAGRTIPIKLQLTDAAGNSLSSADISVLAIGLYQVNADQSRTQVSLQDAGGSNPNDLFRYDSSIGGYIFNLSTKGLGAGTYVFDWMAGDDPTTHELGFKLV
jgi:hypothetical protein